MNYKIKFFLLCCFIFLGQLLEAQNIKVSGEVLDETGAPLVGATIVTSGTGGAVLGTVVDFDGGYSLMVDSNATLVFSFVGYRTQKVDVNGNTVINVTLMPDIDSLEEIVILGYNRTKKENIVGSVATVKGERLMETGLTNMSQAIQDRLPGVYTEITSGQPGADDAVIRVRGVASFSGSNDPLILIDGIEATGGFSQLDPSEIASISILKDASSTAVYGVRGANGVIIITTNRGRLGSPKITVGAAVTAKTISEIPDKLSSYDVLTLGQEAIKNSGAYNQLRPQRYIDTFLDPNRDPYAFPDVDWYDEIIRDIGWESNARINVRGGTEFVKYFSSLSINRIGDILKTEDFNGYYDPEFSYDKINFRTNLDFQVSSTTKLSVDVSGRTDIRKSPDADVGSNQFSNLFKFIDQATSYGFPLYYPEEFVLANPDPFAPFPGGIRYSSSQLENPGQTNPYTKINYSGMRKFKTDVVDVQLNLNQNLDGITEGLVASGKFNYSTAYDYQKIERYNPHQWLYDPILKEWRSQRSGFNYNQNNPVFRSSGGETFSSTRRNIYYEFKLNYQRNFGDHNVQLLGVFNRQERDIGIVDVPRYSEDWAGIFNYNYKERYYLNGSAGYNGFENYARGKRFGFFPAVAVAWNIAKEKIVSDNVSWLNEFKVRYSYGKTGLSQLTGLDRFVYLGGYAGTNPGFGHIQFGVPRRDEIQRWAEVKVANPNTTWENSTKQDLGFDIKLFDYDLTIGVTLYKELREDLLLTPPRPSYFQPHIGTNPRNRPDSRVSLPRVNVGTAKNHGLEIEANYRHTTPGDLTYSFGGHATFADSRSVFQLDGASRPEYQKNAGKPIGWIDGYYSNGFINNFEESINAPEISGGTNTAGHYFYSDFNANGRIDVNDRIPLDGTSQPQIVYAFNSSITYKGFNLSVRFFGKEGVLYHTDNLFPNFDRGLLEAKTAHLDRWTPENQNARFPAYGNIDGQKGYGVRSNMTAANSSYLKLQNVNLAYSIESEFLKRALRIQTMRLNLSGQNLYTWSKLPYGEPEGGNSLSGGNGQYPLVKRFVFGVNIDF
ncbi:SusC/RagA family TonB-linked outer membrane protein [Flavivirga eckloniae]|uniref:TonB-dependent receptor plug domain-containing protein n=1 Tax=Flavivirga eckloniae TaxID=1803846 RepID=A0A2K9PUD7_9FLAO|nr:TonB-dependent receptor [Flavivirga eckloniae]AUP80659.1 hypothetical protein C1H87_18845 [Flavivirga eckloniae]